MTLPTPILASMPPLAEASYWMPVQASEFAPRIDWVFYFILGISVIFFVLITVLMVLFAVRYRAPVGEISTSTITHNTKLEVAWSIVPSIIVIIIFFFGFIEYLDVYTPPRDAYEVFVNVEYDSWQWTFIYPNGVVVTGEEGAVFPLNENIRLAMTAEDYIHSFFVPAFRVKRDLMPGRYTHTWFNATRANDPEDLDDYYHLFCAEYCGRLHSRMIGKIYIWPQEDFDEWMAGKVAEMEDPDPFQTGERLYRRYCATCHATTEEVRTGPPLDLLFNQERVMTDQSRFDYEEDPEEFENYVRTAILDPETYTLAEFAGEAGTMPTFRGEFDERELRALIIYLKSLAPRTRDNALKDRLEFLREHFPERFEELVEELRDEEEIDVDRLLEELDEETN